MADLQTQFKDFHKNIRLGTYTNNTKLAAKRDLIVKSLKDGLAKQTEEGSLSLVFSHFDQGSYAMHTGIKPLDKEDDYDIDVGIEFDLSEDDCEDYRDDPVELKKRIRDALQSGNRTVQIKEPCVRVQYYVDEAPDYHVDLAIYRTDTGDHLLGRGKEFSSLDHRLWDMQDPKGLKDEINEKQPSGEGRDQYRRVIKYLKRWNDGKLSNSNIPNIALTCVAYSWFEYITDIDGNANDLNSLLSVAQKMRSAVIGSRLSAYLPVYPHNDLLSELTDTQMENFIAKLDQFIESLSEALESDDAHEASKLVANKLIGFPIVDKKETAKTAAVIGFASTGASA